MGWGSVAMFLFVWGATQNLKSQQYISTVHGFRGLSVNYDFFILIPNILPIYTKKIAPPMVECQLSEKGDLWLQNGCCTKTFVQVLYVPTHKVSYLHMSCWCFVPVTIEFIYLQILPY
jgi:hypothetical protein